GRGRTRNLDGGSTFAKTPHGTEHRSQASRSARAAGSRTIRRPIEGSLLMRRRSSMPFCWMVAFLGWATAATAGDDATARARALYQEGARLYNLGQYDAAVQSFEAAYAISGAKPLLFNIAQAYRLAGPARCDSALQAYESYLRED